MMCTNLDIVYWGQNLLVAFFDIQTTLTRSLQNEQAQRRRRTG